MVRFSSHFAKQIPIKHIAGNAWALMKNNKLIYEYDQYHPIFLFYSFDLLRNVSGFYQ